MNQTYTIYLNGDEADVIRAASDAEAVATAQRVWGSQGRGEVFAAQTNEFVGSFFDETAHGGYLHQCDCPDIDQ
jgi:hypothetical protein